MSTNTQPSEHAMRAALIQSAPLIAMSGMDKPEAHDMVKRDARIIDQHAIAPAVAEATIKHESAVIDLRCQLAERDKRIAELVDGFLRIASMTMSHVATAQDGFTRCREIADEMLAKHGASHE